MYDQLVYVFEVSSIVLYTFIRNKFRQKLRKKKAAILPGCNDAADVWRDGIRSPHCELMLGKAWESPFHPMANYIIDIYFIYFIYILYIFYIYILYFLYIFYIYYI